MYEWDELKNEANYERHRISFELAYQFDWSIAVVEQDERFDYGEVRYRAFGRIASKG